MAEYRGKNTYDGQDDNRIDCILANLFQKKIRTDMTQQCCMQVGEADELGRGRMSPATGEF